MSREARETNGLLARQWLKWLEDIGRSTETIHVYRSTMRNYMLSLGNTDLTAANLTHVEKFLHRPRQTKTGKASAATIRMECAALKTFYKWCLGRGLVQANPCELVVKPKIHNVNPKAIDLKTWVALWTDPEPLTPEDRFILGAGYFLGLRRGEMVRLTTAHIDLEAERLIDFRRKGGGTHNLTYGSMLKLYEQKQPETKNHVKLFRLACTELVRKAGDGYLLHDEVPRFRTNLRFSEIEGGQWPADRVANRLHRACGLAGVPNFGPHSLRHSAATNLIGFGVPLHMVADLLNHSSIDMTMRYVKVGADPLADMLAS